MNFLFEWDEEKADININKHHVNFQEGVTVFDDLGIATIYDPDHSNYEERYISIGYSLQGRLIVVSYTEHEETIRIISCRKATKKERKTYEEY
ncbi:MAG: BrnT family toxin [Desulfamplus sp.]|nr:BrnT family toxin [Desulfamplus sp.]